MGMFKRKWDLEKLEGCLKDLQDDSGGVSELNRELTALSDDVYDSLECARTKNIITMIEGYAEPYQYSDREISSAIDNVKREISAVRGEIEVEEEAERVAREAGSLFGM